ncbi:MAG: cytochrome c [Shimia thalassica]|uniref:c-type cytochrome n=1 Tax=Shimia thalassica TaxID=1715693 RepID=UPI0032978651
MRLIWGTTIVAVACLLVACTQVSFSGRSVYDHHCASCHGPTGKGDGDFADMLLMLPPDLTVLAAQNGGEFPRLRVTEAIQGKGREDHFSSGAMPEFADVAGTGVLADQQLEILVDYLESLQVQNG